MNTEAAAPRSPSTHTGRRSRTVCYRCNSKKIKCDLEHVDRSAMGSGHGRCSACIAADANCEYRPSNKGRRRVPRTTTFAPVPDSASTYQPPAGTTTATSSQYLGESSFISLFNDDTSRGPDLQSTEGVRAIDQIPIALQQSNIEIYFKRFYVYCPVIDPDMDNDSIATITSPLIIHTLALLASTVHTPLTPHATPEEHYERARHLFHTSTGIDSIDGIRAAMLLHMWGPKPPHMSNMSMNSKSWWHSIAIHLAQDAGLHREPKPSVEKKEAGLRRRIWWSLFARERIGGICQGRPCLIDPDFCNVRLPGLEDFPAGKEKEAMIFVHHVRLSIVVGQVNKAMYLHRNNFPTLTIAARLIEWVSGLPSELQLPISAEQTMNYDRNVHVLHLPYLATISLIYLNNRENSLPKALIPAVIAAACTARLFEDLLARDSTILLNGSVGWYATIAILALMHVKPMGTLSEHAAQHIKLLRTALKAAAKVWHSAKMLDEGIDRLLAADTQTTLQPAQTRYEGPRDLLDLCAGDGVQWIDFFPFVTAQTSPLIGTILSECQRDYPQLWAPIDLEGQFKEFWEEFSSSSSELLWESPV